MEKERPPAESGWPGIGVIWLLAEEGENLLGRGVGLREGGDACLEEDLRLGEVGGRGIRQTSRVSDLTVDGGLLGANHLIGRPDHIVRGRSDVTIHL